VNSNGYGASLGITSFKMTYFDTLGTLINLSSPTTDTVGRSKIKSIKIQMYFMNQISVDTTLAASFDTTFSATYWERWYSPKNLRVLK